MIGIGTAAEPVTYPIEVGTLKAGLRTYEEAKIVGVDPVGVKVVHGSGTARVPFESLPAELRSRFTHDRQAAKEQVKQEAAASRAYEQQLAASEEAVLLEEDGSEGTGSGTKKRSESELMADMLRAEAWQEYILRLRSGILRTESEITKVMLRGQQSQVRAMASSGYYSRRSFRAASRMIGKQIQTLPQQEKIAQAKLLIDYAESQIERLEK